MGQMLAKALKFCDRRTLYLYTEARIELGLGRAITLSER